MNNTKTDAVLIGGGHNGLVAATRMARSGMRVIVLEANEQAGGAARGYEIHPGFHLPALAHMLVVAPEQEMNVEARFGQ